MKGKRLWVLAGSGVLFILAAAFVWGFSRHATRVLTICEIQGNVEISAFAGQEVKTWGLVRADQLVLDPAGFFLVDPECDIPEGSSAGIFVQLNAPGDLVHEGDEVRLKGEVQEIGGESRIVTAPDQVVIHSLGNTLPPAVNLSELMQGAAGGLNYEEWEGQLVYIGSGEVLDPIITGGRLRVLPSLEPPPGSQLICIREESITLGLMALDQIWGHNKLHPGTMVTNLRGYLRQETGGFAIQLVPDQVLEIISQDEIITQKEAVFDGFNAAAGTGTPEPDEGTAAPSATSFIIPNPTIIPSPTWYPVDLLISEILPNPAGKEPQGEWFEIYNPKSYGQLLTGIKVGDETSPGGKEGVLRFPDGYYIEAKKVLVIARQAVEFQSQYGFLPDFELEASLGNVPDLLPYDGWGRSSVQFSNSGDEVILLDPWDQIVDALAYGNGSAPGFSSPPDPPAEGNSLERYPPERDRDSGEDWRERKNPSPGKLDRSPPTQAPSATSLPSTSPAALSPTFTLSPSPTPSPTYTETALSTITPTFPTAVNTGTAAVSPAPEKSPTQSQTVTPVPILTATLFPTSSITLSPVVSPTPTPVLSETPSLSATCSQEASQTPDPDPSPEPSLTPSPEWAKTETPAPSETSTFDPLFTATIIPSLGLVLNEIHADPDPIAGDANGDGVVSSDDDEFIELVNSGEQALDLSGWQVLDSVRVRFTFPEETILEAGCALVVFGGGEPMGDFGGSMVFITSSLGLNNTGDLILLLDDNGIERIHTIYGVEGGEDQSLTLSPDLVGEPPLVPHSLVPEALGALYSPGTRLDGSPFAEGQ